MDKRKFIFVFIGLILVTIIVAYFGFLPFEVKYHAEIDNGRKIINEMNKYFEKNQKYPDEYDWDTLEKIYRNSFLKDKIDFNELTQPYYKTVGDEYILIYVYGFDGPNLWYYSKSKTWEYGIDISLE